MKNWLPVLFVLSVVQQPVFSQITSPVIRANFGVDGELRANYFSTSLQPGNDDWYNLPGTPGIGAFIIDTTGAAAIVARYATDIPFRRTTFARTMNYTAYSVVNNRVVLDAIMVRDFHGDDSTVFASGSNKNGDNPLDWSTPVSQGIPDKNDILDMFVHVRRAGPTGTDSLWMFGGMSLDNTTGNRYFDFEMYQTDLYYDRPNLQFLGAGPDAGHTIWEFDSAGNITKAGDIIFSAEYQSSSLSNIEARIWIDKANLSMIPAAFSWSGSFDGASAGATFGYAGILPKLGGTYYTGLQCGNNTWGGPFSIILQNDAIETNYDARQFVEFSVNLTKLGLDPITRLGGDPCGMPFRRILVKTRASASFTAELKDFVAPFAFFDVPMAEVETETPYICDSNSVAEIHVTNPLSTSAYQWSTPDGNIIGSTTGPSIYVNLPGTYIVTQTLLTGCATYATDTIEIMSFSPYCNVLSGKFKGLRGSLRDQSASLDWEVTNNQSVSHFEIQRSEDGRNFQAVANVENDQPELENGHFVFHDPVKDLSAPVLFYRIKLVNSDQSIRLSNIVRLTPQEQQTGIMVFPNPVKDVLNIQVNTGQPMNVTVQTYDPAGRKISHTSMQVQQGSHIFTLPELSGKPNGLYIVLVRAGEDIFTRKVFVSR